MLNFFKDAFFKILNNNKIFGFCILLILGSSIFLIFLPFFMFFIKLFYFALFNFEINAFTFQCFCLDFINRINIYYSTYLIEKFDFACYLLQFLFGYSFTAANSNLTTPLNFFFAFLLFLILICCNFLFFVLWFNVQILAAIDFFFVDFLDLDKYLRKSSLFEIEAFKVYYNSIFFFSKLINAFNINFYEFWNSADDFEKMIFIYSCFILLHFCYNRWISYKKYY